MEDYFITQVELAKFCGCKQPYIVKLKQKGLFDDILENGKFPRCKATEAAKIYQDNKDLRREPQRIANEEKRNGGEISPGKEKQNRPEIPKNNFGMFDVSYLGAEAQIELNTLIGTNDKAVHKIQIKDAFIESKKKEIEFKKELGVLIELEEAEEVMELVASNMKTKMYNAPHLLKSKYSRVTKEEVTYLHKLIDDAFAEFNKYGLEER